MYKFLSFLLLIIWYKWNMDNYFYLNMDRHFSNTLIKKQKKKKQIFCITFFLTDKSFQYSQLKKNPNCFRYKNF